MVVGFEAPRATKPGGPRPGSSRPGRAVPLSISMRSGVLSHRSPWVRMAPWLLLIALVFGLAFLPLMVLPELDRWLFLQQELATAEQAAREAEATATSLNQLADELPGLVAQVQDKESRLVDLGDLPAMVSRLAQQAASTGAVLDAATFGPYQPIRPTGKEATGQGSTGSGTTGDDNPEPSTGAGSGQAGDGSAGEDVAPYGRVTVEVTATGTWNQLAELAGRVVADPGLRVRGWSVAEGDGGTYRMSLSADLFIKGRPAVSQGFPITVDELAAQGAAQGQGEGEAAGNSSAP